MSDRQRALILRRRRLLALAVLLSLSIAFFRVAFWTDDADEDGMLRVAYAIAALMVLGTLGFGLALWQLRCPRCGYHYGSDVAGGVQILGHSFVDAIVALVRRFRCPSCHFDERRALESED